MTAICAVDGCNRPVRDGKGTRYCSLEHHREAKRQRKREWTAMRKDAGKPLGLDRRAGNGRPPGESRQRPMAQTFRLLPGALVIRPARPSPLRFYRSGSNAGRPMLFQDDLDAIADHGSPGWLAV